MATARQPNILLLLSDQHQARMRGVGGDPQVRTPALDRLARAGVCFNNAYCNSPLCVPSRMSLLTSRHPHQLGIWGNDDELPSLVPTFAHGLGAAGYRTVLVGRMHFVGGDQQHGFEERRVGDVSSGYIGVNRAEHRFRGFYGERESLDSAGPGAAHDLAFDAAVAAEACCVIRDHEVARDPRPLCLVVGFYSPHDPYRIYPRYFDRYARTPDLPHDPDGRALHPVLRARRERGAYEKVTRRQIGRARAAYRGKVEFLDELLGQILEHFAESPLARHAVTLYTSDHGEMLGEHGLWAKQTFYEAAGRVPLIVAGTGVRRGARRALVSLLDLAPTLLDLGRAEALPGAVGRSLRPLLEGRRADPATVVLSEAVLTRDGGPCRSVRQGAWKFNLYAGHADPELFNLRSDPREDRDLAADSRYAATREALRALAFADGWSPERIRQQREARGPDRRYLCQWAKRNTAQHPVQWGLPAEL